MTKDEIKNLSTEKLLDELDYCGCDTYYLDYRNIIIAEIKSRLNKNEQQIDILKTELTEDKPVIDLVTLTKESREIRAQFDSLTSKKNSSISYFAYKDCDNEQQFKMSVVKYILKNIFDCVFCIETEETVQGFPDVMCLYKNLNGGTSALFYEFKYSNKSGKIKFQPTQPAFYKKYNDTMQITIVAYDQRTKKAVKFSSSCLFDKESPYYMNEKAEVQL